MTSYMLQGIASFFFGPLLAMASIFAEDAARPLGQDSIFLFPSKIWLAEHLVPVATSIQQANILVALSVFVASVVRLRQVTPLAELKFLASLANYQAITAGVCTISYLTIHQRSALRTTAVCIYMVVALVMYIYVSEVTKATYPVTHGKALQVITAFCTQYRNWPAAEINLEQPIGPERPSFTWADFSIVGLATVCLALVVVSVPAVVLGWEVLKCAYRKMGPTLRRGYRRLWERTRFGPLGFAVNVIIFIGTIVVTYLMCASLTELVRLRDKLRVASGDEYADDEWGFGQVTAVMAWVPVAQDVFFALLGKFLYLPHSETEWLIRISPISCGQICYGSWVNTGFSSCIFTFGTSR